MQISSFISLLDFKANIGNLLARIHATRNKETKARKVGGSSNTSSMLIFGCETVHSSSLKLSKAISFAVVCSCHKFKRPMSRKFRSQSLPNEHNKINTSSYHIKLQGLYIPNFVWNKWFYILAALCWHLTSQALAPSSLHFSLESSDLSRIFSAQSLRSKSTSIFGIGLLINRFQASMLPRMLEL